jgi:hypothetical protein
MELTALIELGVSGAEMMKTRSRRRAFAASSVATGSLKAS